MWMESLRSKDSADFCKRHLFKFSPKLSRPQKEWGRLFVCRGKNSTACRLEFWKMSFPSVSHHNLNSICRRSRFFVIDWQRNVIRKRRCFRGRHGGRCFNFYTKSLLTRKMHTQNFHFNQKLSFKKSSNWKSVWIKVWDGPQIYSGAHTVEKCRKGFDFNQSSMMIQLNDRGYRTWHVMMIWETN